MSHLSLYARREDLNKTFFRKVFNNPENPLFDLLPPPRDAAIIGRLRSAHLIPVPRTRTTRLPIIYTSWFDPLPTKIKINHPTC